MDNRRFRLERIGETAVVRRAGHKLGDTLRAFGADRVRVEAALPPDQPHEGHGRQSARLGLLLHQRADRIHEGLRPGRGKPCGFEAGGDTSDDEGLRRLRAVQAEHKPRGDT
ncbi:hypothetical protein AUC69_15705 [Methyloceanibacter superfactus]|uniref:Uncharacterized protein n=1 Tax=Methyloceanibacter superfactus TaxID=1774969 RepID=A0A1E3VTB1_9HYPH|nr:hypothetical protein AUC69_15705 [Methyloceanibacter superfactus]